MAMCGRSMHWSADQIRYHALLGERPHAVTWRELDAILEKTDDRERAHWLTRHSSERGVPPQEVARECISACIARYGKELEAAAYESTAEAHHSTIARATNVLALFEWLWFRSDEGAQARSSEFFLRILGTCRREAHFVLNDDDRKQRAEERALLVRMAEESEIPLDYLEKLAPWDPRCERHGEAAALTRDVVRPLEGRAATEVLRAFDQPSGVSGCLFGARVADRHILLHRNPMWTPEHTTMLSEKVAHVTQMTADNCRVLLEVIARPDRADRWIDATELRSDRELLRVLWRGATGVPVQARFFKGIVELRDQINALLPEPLPEPRWWERAASLVEDGGGSPAPGERQGDADSVTPDETGG
jgi:hypothetical protein